ARGPPHSYYFPFHLRLKSGPEFCRWKINIRHAKLARDVQNAGIENIGDNQTRVCGEFGGADLFEDSAAIAPLARSKNSQCQKTHGEENFFNLSINPDVEYPGSKGRMRICAPIFSKAARSSGSSVSEV